MHEANDPPLDALAARGVPDGLVDLVRRAMHKQRHFRYKSASHLLRGVDELALNLPPETILNRRVAEIVLRALDSAQAACERPDPTPELTTFDLIARRAREKRRRPDS